MNREIWSSFSRHSKIWSWRWESNPQPADYKSAALPVELRQQQVWELISKDISWQEEFFLSSGVPRKQQKTCTQEAALCKAFSSLFSNFFYSRRFSVSFRAYARHALSPADCPVVSFSERFDLPAAPQTLFFRSAPCRSSFPWHRLSSVPRPTTPVSRRPVRTKRRPFPALPSGPPSLFKNGKEVSDVRPDCPALLHCP